MQLPLVTIHWSISEELYLQNMSSLVYRLFGREKPVHHVLGGGKPANILLWRDKKISAGVLAGATLIWVLFELVGYHLLTFVCHGLELSLILLFLWSKTFIFINKSRPRIPEVWISEEQCVKVAVTLTYEINKAFAVLREVALGWGLKKFLAVIAGLWLLSIVGSSVNFLSLLYILFVTLHTVPVLYEKYDDKVHAYAERVMAEIKKQYAVSWNPSSSQLLSITDGLSKRSFTYEELVTSTNNFSEANLLGEGGFSYVYKGMLTDGTEVAIKRLKVTRRPTDLEFMKEANILSLVHHRNLVSLIGFCIYKQNWILVCEYVPNKTLEFHLHGTNRPTLAWTDRYEISLETARGLAYLHEDCQPRIIHRDVKAANILLDHSFRAKIADFGIAKHFSDDKTHVSTIVKGTYGYLDPEYLSTGQITDKSDVYSYGVVLLELITGKKPAALVDWAGPFPQRALKNGTYDALIDPSLDNNYNPNEMSRLVECASACLCHTASLRPSMIQIVRALEGYTSLGDQTLRVPNRSLPIDSL